MTDWREPAMACFMSSCSTVVTYDASLVPTGLYPNSAYRRVGKLPCGVVVGVSRLTGPPGNFTELYTIPGVAQDYPSGDYKAGTWWVIMHCPDRVKRLEAIEAGRPYSPEGAEDA